MVWAHWMLVNTTVNKTDKSLYYHPSWSIYSSVKRLQRNKSEFLKVPPHPSMPLARHLQRGGCVVMLHIFSASCPVREISSHLVPQSCTNQAWILSLELRSYFNKLSSVTQSCLTLCDPMDCSTMACLSITNSRDLLKLMSIESVMPSNHLILCCPLVLLPSIFSSIKAFSSESVLRIRWPKYWSFSFSISPSNSSFPFFLFNVELLMYAIPYEKLFQLWVEKVIGREVTLI